MENFTVCAVTDSNSNNKIGKRLKNNDSSSRKEKEKKNVAIVGDRLIQHLKDYEMSKKVGKCTVFMKSLGGAKVRCMKDHMKPTIRKKPDHFILHIGTNNLNSEREPELTSKSIVDLACRMKCNSVDVSISNVIVRNHKYNKNVLQ